MRLEDQCVSLELAKKLKELGVEQVSHFSWVDTNMEGDYKLEKIRVSDIAEKLDYSAYTVAELGGMLKHGRNLLIPVTIQDEWRGVDLKNHGVIVLGKMGEMTEADARAKMLIYLLENNLLKD